MLGLVAMEVIRWQSDISNMHISHVECVKVQNDSHNELTESVLTRIHISKDEDLIFNAVAFPTVVSHLS